jgi:glucose-6-phosphate-specific signal transduction histidine kinase
MMIGNAGMLLFVGWRIGRRRRRIYYMALIVLLVNVALTLADDFGPFDFIILVLAGILLAARSLYRDAA